MGSGGDGEWGRWMNFELIILNFEFWLLASGFCPKDGTRIDFRE
jgi:hypothetical protein